MFVGELGAGLPVETQCANCLALTGVPPSAIGKLDVVAATDPGSPEALGF